MKKYSNLLAVPCPLCDVRTSCIDDDENFPKFRCVKCMIDIRLSQNIIGRKYTLYDMREIFRCPKHGIYEYKPCSECDKEKFMSGILEAEFNDKQKKFLINNGYIDWETTFKILDKQKISTSQKPKLTMSKKSLGL
jgi:hypothetical protein